MRPQSLNFPGAVVRAGEGAQCDHRRSDAMRAPLRLFFTLFTKAEIPPTPRFFFFYFFFSWSSIKVRRCPFTPRTHKNTSADEGCNRLNKRIKVLNVRNKVKDGTVWPTYGAGNTLLYHFYLNTHLDAAPRLSTLTPGYNLQSVFFFFK